MPLDTILLILAVILFFYFLMIRPMRKQVAAQTALRNSLEVGSRVQLSSGIFGTIKHLGDRQAIIELAPGVEITVLKQSISGLVTAADEEFEYDDATADDVSADDADEFASDEFAPDEVNQDDLASDEFFSADGADTGPEQTDTEPADTDQTKGN